MPTSQSNTHPTMAILHPPCPKCGARMNLTRLEPADVPGHDQRTFECAACAHAVIEVVKYK